MVSCGMFFVRALDLAGHGLKCTENGNIRGCQRVLPDRRNHKRYLNAQSWSIPRCLSMCGKSISEIAAEKKEPRQSGQASPHLEVLGHILQRL